MCLEAALDHNRHYCVRHPLRRVSMRLGSRQMVDIDQRTLSCEMHKTQVSSSECAASDKVNIQLGCAVHQGYAHRSSRSVHHEGSTAFLLGLLRSNQLPGGLIEIVVRS